MSESLPGIVALVVLLLVNAFFVGAEFAVISARRSQIEPKAEAGSRAAKTTLWAMEHATMMLATTQLGITICSLLILNVSEPSIHHLLEGPLGLTGLSEQLVSVVGFVITLLLVSFLHVVLGEMVPKNISFSLPDKAALLLAPPLVAVARLLHVVVVSLNWSANAVLRAFRVEPKDEAASAYTVDEVATIVAQSQREGTLRDGSGTLQAAFEFTEKRSTTWPCRCRASSPCRRTRRRATSSAPSPRTASRGTCSSTTAATRRGTCTSRTSSTSTRTSSATRCRRSGSAS